MIIMNPKIRDHFESFVKAYGELCLTPADFDFPSQIVNAQIQSVVRMHSSSMGEMLEHQLDQNKQRQLENEIYELESIKRGHKEEQIAFLKRQIVLNELKTELEGIETLFSQVRTQLTPNVESLFLNRLDFLKNEIEKKGSKGLLP